MDKHAPITPLTLLAIILLVAQVHWWGKHDNFLPLFICNFGAAALSGWEVFKGMPK